jgi:hypothetical protein
MRKKTARELKAGREVETNPSEKLLRGKLARLCGLLEGTAHSACDYSAEALRDRMKYMVAFITDDRKGMEKWEKFGDLCHKESEEQQAREEIDRGQDVAPELNVLEVGRVCVDSGQIMIADPCRKIEYEDAMLGDENVKQVTGAENDSTYGEDAPLAVVSSTGMGDGIYPVYAAITDCGMLGKRVAALVVDFDLDVQREAFLKLCIKQTKEGEAA